MGCYFYEIYAQDGEDWTLLTGSSNTSVYLPKLTRQATANGKKQALKVVAVGKNGKRSSESLFDFDWGLDTSDTTLPKALAPNVVIGAKVTGSDFGEKDAGEGIENMLNGTITSLSDKWSSAQLRGSVYIKLTEPRTIRRWAMDHAGAGGESVNDGLMNTKDFELHYKNEEGKWVLAKGIYGNKEHVTDVVLDEPIKAQEWGLKVITSDNGTPWKAIRIYNWRMYEELDNETPNIPMTNAFARDLGDQHIQVAFKDVPSNTTLYLYDSKDSTEPIATVRTTQEGDLILEPIAFKIKPSVIYYRAKSDDKDISHLLAIPLVEGKKEISSLELNQVPVKKVYGKGDKLSLKGGLIKVHLQDQKAELVSLTNPAVTVSGFNPEVLGEQHLKVTYLNREVPDGIKVYVVQPEELSEKTLIGLQMTALPETNYIVGDPLSLKGGVVKAIYSDDTEESHELTSSDVQVLGYQADMEGRQSITVTYKGKTTHFDVLVSPKVAVNDEYLKQRVADGEVLQEKVDVLFASDTVKEQFVSAMTEARSVIANDDKTDEMVSSSLELLNQAITALDGQISHQKALDSLEQWRVKVEQLKGNTKELEMVDLLNKAKGYVMLESLDKQAFDQIVEQLRGLIENVEFVKVPDKAPVAEDKPVLKIMDLNKVMTQDDTIHSEQQMAIKSDTTAHQAINLPSPQAKIPTEVTQKMSPLQMATQTQKENRLPNTGELSHPILEVAALTMIAGLGVLGRKKRDDLMK